MDIKKFIQIVHKEIDEKLDERSRRLLMAAEAKALGRGGITLVAQVNKASRVTITHGVQELSAEQGLPSENLGARIRRAGGGRKKVLEINEGLKERLEEILAPHTLGDPERVLLWTSKSLRKLSAELTREGFRISHVTVGEILEGMGFSLQGNRKSDEGEPHEERNAQFELIDKLSRKFLKHGYAVISVDCKKKENIGNYKNAGQEWTKKGEAANVNAYDFIDPEKGKAIPYGVYDIGRNEGWVSVGIDHDTAEFAVNSIKSWWIYMGRQRYEGAEKIFITADGGGSNSVRGRLWKKELQRLSNYLQMEIHVSHFPPGTSKWNKIEHRLFSYISKNWRAKPLETIEVIVNLISSTTTATGLHVKAKVDKRKYKTAKKVSVDEWEEINITSNKDRPQWNYVIKPNIE
jgi:hypothetical protein